MDPQTLLTGGGLVLTGAIVTSVLNLLNGRWQRQHEERKAAREEVLSRKIRRADFLRAAYLDWHRKIAAIEPLRLAAEIDATIDQAEASGASWEVSVRAMVKDFVLRLREAHHAGEAVAFVEQDEKLRVQVHKLMSAHDELRRQAETTKWVTPADFDGFKTGVETCASIGSQLRQELNGRDHLVG